MRNRLIDVVVDAQGRDIFDQGGRPIERRGVLIDPNEIVRLRTHRGTDGTTPKLSAATVTDILALARHEPEKMEGILRFTVFYGAPEETQRQTRIRENEPRRSYEYR
ncbi:MAG: hypothetical protein JNJ83_11960 [Verrucomicrobiaceae bacterium]|nr:hypothetical protein [Verrucomicrobiaceae bacterium]